MITFSISDIPEFSKKERIVIVGIIGKSTYRYPNKATPLLSSVGNNKDGVECYWDERKSVLYLHASTYLDSTNLTKLAENLDGDSKSTVKEADAAHWLVASGELAIESCRAIALIFQLAHIVILSSPTPVFDLGYLQLFKAIDAYRAEQTSQKTAALTAVGVGGIWEAHGRFCCPRLLFHFHRAPVPLRKAPAALKRLEHAIEDQIYFILRKTRIITNVCAKSLFAIPKNEEFVYISADDDIGNARDVSSLIRGLVHLCTGIEHDPTPQRNSFGQFLQGHIDLAFGEGFDDNVGKYAMNTSFFELPSAISWRAVARALAPVYLSPEEGDVEGGALFDALATDVRFSQARCAKVLPIAQASYAEGLPPHYSRQHHLHKVHVAMGVVEAMARGPLAAGARVRLQTACDAAWRTRSLCEAPSLTGHPCIHPNHDSSKEHSSGVRYTSACACGRVRTGRDDPYSVRRANCGFYTLAAAACSACDALPAIHFPVFQPSTTTYRAASVKGDDEVTQGQDSKEEEPPTRPSPPSSSYTPPDELSPGSERDEEEDEPACSDTDIDVVTVREDTTTEKVITRQPSTTEYLPGMLHTGSPVGLLPAYPSWSLVCLGPSSLYSHSLGLPDHLQPGFLQHANYLVPWDCNVRLEQANAWRAVSSRGRGKGAGPHQLTVKIFIGFEFECPKGHRFMMTSPEGGTSGGGGAWSREDGARLAVATLPLRTACACRNPQLARLMRLHVVTPKAPVHVTLHPKAQPVPGGPVFIPQPLSEPPIKLSASAYWVLRLPYVYADERGPIPRAVLHSLSPQPPGALLPPHFGLQE
ncbi:protein SMG8 [Aricia agestis]|uniref:protein SMG8 n=1 Tax=Aricia agestis TaxID=91739 RepID=UPI001C203CA4|nr:protein SMG8 [Aricia agestis]